MQITITQEDIDKGERKNGWACPVRRACCRALGRTDLIVGKFLWTGPETKHALPKIAVEFMAIFDAYGPAKVRPFAFEMTIPT